MDVLLTFDVEVWCNGWDRLDEKFPSAFRRYVFGRSAKGDFALPRLLETLNRHELKGVFFVEPMFSARFGLEHLAAIVSMVHNAGQEVQLHLHSEWTDEIDPPPLPGPRAKRQHLRYYSREEQTTLVAYALKAMRAAGAPEITAFRAGNFGANRDTFVALKANGIGQDSSVNAIMAHSVPDLKASIDLYFPSVLDGVDEYPMSVFRDGLGQLRHAQLTACSASELVNAIEGASRAGWRQFVILGHNFELLRLNSAEPDSIVVQRFDALCSHLGRRHGDLPTKGFRDLPALQVNKAAGCPLLPRVPFGATLRRHSEQALRRFVNRMDAIRAAN